MFDRGVFRESLFDLPRHLLLDLERRCPGIRGLNHGVSYLNQGVLSPRHREVRVGTPDRGEDQHRPGDGTLVYEVLRDRHFSLCSAIGKSTVHDRLLASNSDRSTQKSLLSQRWKCVSKRKAIATGSWLIRSRESLGRRAACATHDSRFYLRLEASRPCRRGH